MKDNSNQVINTTLLALSGVKDIRLLEHYKHLVEKLSIEQEYTLNFLNHTLSEYGLTSETVLKKNADTHPDSNDISSKKKWYEIWK